MRILITNDDGYTAPGLTVAEEIAREIAGPDGEVWIVAPESEQSGVGHCVSYTKPMRIIEHGNHRYAVEGSPADCVLVALQYLMKDCPPDLVLSGVNRGHNVAEDTLYSGTVGAAIEAVLARFKAISMSQYYGPANKDLPDTFEAARIHGAAVVRKILEQPFNLDDPRYSLFYNVNFPPVPAENVIGMKATIQGRRPLNTMKVTCEKAPNGRDYLWLGHGMGNQQCEVGTDAREASEGHITITPMRAEFTAHDQVSSLDAALAK